MLKWISKALGVKRRKKRKGLHHRKAVRVEAAHKGALHRQLHVPAGKKIPLKKLRAAAKRGGKLGKRARLALTLRKLRRKRRK